MIAPIPDPICILAAHDLVASGACHRINAHVDAKFSLNAPGRYANDHFDKTRINARFDKNKPQRRAKLIATRHIQRGEEIYVSYGETYWRARNIDPETGARLKRDDSAAGSGVR